MADGKRAGGAPVTEGDASRKQLGAWYTPADLVDRIVDAVVTPPFVAGIGDRAVRVLDPACGDGRFLLAVSERVRSLGARCELVGADIDRDAAERARRTVPCARIHRADALARDWRRDRFDLVIGNPPFLSQMASATSRGGSSELGGGPYADAAAEFLSLASRLVEPNHGRVAFVLPQSILSARDAGDVRAGLNSKATMIWSWSSDERIFDAQVHVCALAFEFGRAGPSADNGTWSHVVIGRQQIPSLPDHANGSGTLGDRARLNANFRDEYYGMIPAVGDHDAGPRLITSGLIDPGVSRWGERQVTFARRRFAAPRIDIASLDPKMQRWARKRLVPKVLVANQTRIIEAVCDPMGDWLPAVPVVAIYPDGSDVDLAWRIAAVLNSPVASVWAWHRSAGTGMSASTIRLGPAMLAELPWPAGSLTDAVAAIRVGDVRRAAVEVAGAYGLIGDTELFRWWDQGLRRIEARHAPS